LREIEVREPDTGRLIASYSVIDATGARERAAAARAAGAEWRRLGVRRRAAAVGRIRHRIVERLDEIAEVIGRETGKPVHDVLLTEILTACDNLAWLERAAPRVLASHRVGHRVALRRGMVRHEAYGVAGIITPWNFPFLLALGSVAAALVAGNSVLLKPSELTPGSGVLVGELAALALPSPDLVQVLTGDASTGQALIDVPVDVLSFTGSVATGKAVMAAAAKHLTPVILELGGKDAMIVLDDADVGRAARAAVWGGFFHAGQVCQSVERVYVQQPIYDRFVAEVRRETVRLTVGGRETTAADVGPLTRGSQLAVIEAHVEDALAGGATAVVGGERLPGSGQFFAPTVLTGVRPSMRVMREETFGPVLPVMSFDRDDEAVRLANDSEYGLDASVWTRDIRRGRRIGRRLEVGTVMLNDCLSNHAMAALPFGGVKHSGFGRTHGEEGLRAFARVRSEAERRRPPARELHWFPGSGGARLARWVIPLKHGGSLRARLAPLLRRRSPAPPNTG